MRLAGLPLTLVTYPAATTTNRHFAGLGLDAFDQLYLPPSLSGLVDGGSNGQTTLLEDDNRGAVSPEPVATLDGMPFYLSVKGVGSSVDPFSPRPLDLRLAASLSEEPAVREALQHRMIPLPPGESDRFVTGEMWLRGSPYGGQGLEHAEIAFRVAERAELTDLNGFRIAPVVKIVHFPPELEAKLRTIHWYRRFPGRFAQEIRLVPSNIRVYFHSRSTLGNDVGLVFDRFGIDRDGAAVRFETAFIRSALAMLTLFGRTLRAGSDGSQYYGLDLHDVWLDKDAVLAPDGTVYFVDLEGIEEIAVPREKVREKIEDQIYRSLYEFMYGFEQMEQERVRRFGGDRSRKSHFLALVREAVRTDRFLRVVGDGPATALEVRNPLGDESLYTNFPLVTP